MDFTSPWVAVNSFSAPHPTRLLSAQTLQKVTSGDRSSFRSSAWTLSGGESSCMFRRCSASKS